MRKFQLLLLNTLQKEFRSKTLLLVSIFTVVIIFLINSLLSYISTEFLSQMGAEGAAQGSAQALIFIISKFTSLLAIVFGVNCIKSDIENNVAPLMLSFPVSRMEYILSRVLGSWFIVIIYYFVSVIIAQILLSTSVGSLIGGPHLLGAMFFSALSNLVIILVASFMGLYMPKIMAFMMTSFFSILVTASNGYFKGKDWSAMTEEMNIFKGIGLGFHAIFPRIGNIDDIGRNILLKVDDTVLNIPMELGHYFVTLILFFTFFYMLFNRREI